MNQCDGCQRKLLVVNGIHMDKGKVYMVCTKHLYMPPDKTFNKVTKKKVKLHQFDYIYEDLHDYGDQI